MAVRSGRNREPFASSVLFALIIRALHEIDQSLLPADTHPPDELANAIIPSVNKSRLLEYAYRHGGALLVEALMRSRDTDVAQRWTRMAQYHCSDNRVQLDSRVRAC